MKAIALMQVPLGVRVRHYLGRITGHSGPERLTPEQYAVEFERCYAQIREPKKREPIVNPPGWDERISQRLQLLGFTVRNCEIDVPQYRQYFAEAQYEENYATYYKSYLVEKSLEHYIAAELLGLNRHDVYIDIASQNSPAPGIYRKLFGSRVYRQDLIYPPGVRGDMIGGDAASMPVPDNFATKMALHCSFEHFEKTSDSGFVREALRVLKSGGTACIVPFYMSESYSIQTDPVVSVPSGVVFEDDAVICCAERWNLRYGRFYDPDHFKKRISDNLVDSGDSTLEFCRFTNADKVDPSCYVRFALLVKKQD